MSLRGFKLSGGIGCHSGGVHQSGDQEICHIQGRDVYFHDIFTKKNRIYSPPLFEEENSRISRNETFSSRLKIEEGGIRLNTSLTIKCCCHKERGIFAYGEQRLHPKVFVLDVDSFEEVFSYEFREQCVEVVSVQFSEDGRYLGVLLHYPTIRVVVFDLEKAVSGQGSGQSSFMDPDKSIHFQRELDDVFTNFRFQKEMVLFGYGLFRFFTISEEDLFDEKFPLRPEEIENTFLYCTFDDTQKNFFLLKEDGDKLFYFAKKNDQGLQSIRDTPTTPPSQMGLAQKTFEQQMSPEEKDDSFAHTKTVLKFNEKNMKSMCFVKEERLLILGGESKIYFIRDLVVVKVIHLDVSPPDQTQMGSSTTVFSNILKMRDNNLFLETSDCRFLQFKEEEGKRNYDANEITTVKRFHETLNILKFDMPIPENKMLTDGEKKREEEEEGEETENKRMTKDSVFLSYSENDIFFYDTEVSVDCPFLVITSFGNPGKRIKKLFQYDDQFYLFNESKELINFSLRFPGIEYDLPGSATPTSQRRQRTKPWVRVNEVIPYPRNLKYMQKKHGHQVLLFDNNEVIVNNEFRLENEKITSFFITPKYFYFCTEESLLKKYSLENDFIFLKKYKLEFPCLSFQLFATTFATDGFENEDDDSDDEEFGGRGVVLKEMTNEDDDTKLLLFTLSEDKSFRIYRNFKLIHEISLIHLLCFKRFENYSCLKSRMTREGGIEFFLGNKDGLFYSIENTGNSISNYWMNHNPGKGIKNFVILKNVVVTCSKKNEILFYSPSTGPDFEAMRRKEIKEPIEIEFYRKSVASEDDLNRIQSEDVSEKKQSEDKGEGEPEEVEEDPEKSEKKDPEATVEVPKEEVVEEEDDGIMLIDSPSRQQIHEQEQARQQSKKLKKIHHYRKRLIQKYKDLKEANENSIESRRLSPDEFRIDEPFIQKQKQKQKENLKRIHKELRKRNLKSNYFIELFRKRFYESMSTKYDVLTSFEGNLKVDNFPLPTIQVPFSYRSGDGTNKNPNKKVIGSALIEKIKFHKRLESYDLYFYRNTHSLFQNQREKKNYFEHLVDEGLFQKKIPILPTIHNQDGKTMEEKDLEFYQNFDLVSYYRILNQMYLFKSKTLELKVEFNGMFENLKKEQKEHTKKLGVLNEKIKSLGEEIRNTLNLLGLECEVIDPKIFLKKKGESSAESGGTDDGIGGLNYEEVKMKLSQNKKVNQEGKTQEILDSILELARIEDLEFDLFQFKKKKVEKKDDDEEKELVIDEKYKKALNKMMFGENILKNENKELNELKKLLKEQRKIFKKLVGNQGGAGGGSSLGGMGMGGSGMGSSNAETKLFNAITEQLNTIFEEQQKKKKQQFAKLRNFKKDIHEIQNTFSQDLRSLKKKKFSVHEQVLRYELKILYLKKMAQKKQNEKKNFASFLKKDKKQDLRTNKFLNYYTTYEKRLFNERKRVNEKIEKNRALDKHSFFNQNGHLLKLFKRNPMLITEEEKNPGLFQNNEEKRAQYHRLKRKKIKNMNAIKKKTKEIDEMSSQFEKLKKVKSQYEKSRMMLMKLKEKKKQKKIKNLFDLYFFMYHKQGKIEHEKRKKILQNFNRHVLVHKKIILSQNQKNKRQSEYLKDDLNGTVKLKGQIKKEKWENEKRKIEYDEKEKLLHDFQMLKVNKEMQMVIKQKRPSQRNSALGNKKERALTKLEKRKEKEKKKFEKRKKLNLQIEYIRKLKKEKSGMMGRKIRRLKRKIADQEQKNQKLMNQMSQLNEILKERKQIKKLQDTKKRKIKKERKMKKIRKEASLKILTKEQERELLFLRREVEKHRKKTFPNFDGISLK